MHKIASIPFYVLQHAPEFISDNELLLLIRLQVVPQTKIGIEQLATLSSYKTINPIMKTLNSLAERELIVLSKYKVATTPLYNLCLQRMCGKIEPPEPKERVKKNNSHFVLAATLIKEGLTSYKDKNGLATKLKPLLKKHTFEAVYEMYKFLHTINAERANNEIDWVFALFSTEHTLEDFKGCAEYVDSWLITQEVTDIRTKPLFLNHVTDKQIQKWIIGDDDGNRKKTFEETIKRLFL